MARRKSSLAEPIIVFSSDNEDACTSQEANTSEGEEQPVNLDKPCLAIYSQACKCKKSSASCLCGLIPTPGGHRKKGLWQKDSQALVVQGPDPGENRREVSPWVL